MMHYNVSFLSSCVLEHKAFEFAYWSIPLHNQGRSLRNGIVWGALYIQLELGNAYTGFIHDKLSLFKPQ